MDLLPVMAAAIPSLTLVVILASVAAAQVNRFGTTPRVLSGGDIGFRVEAIDKDGKPVGTWVVKVNGEWVEVGSRMKAAPATTR